MEANVGFALIGRNALPPASRNRQAKKTIVSGVWALKGKIRIRLSVTQNRQPESRKR
jgi:hypothetical protein